MGDRRLSIVYLAHQVADYRLCTMKHLARECAPFGDLTLLTSNTAALSEADLEAYRSHGTLAVLPGRPLLRLLNSDGEPRFELHFSWQLLWWLLSRKPDVVIAEGFGRWAIHGFLLKMLRPRTRVITSYERTRWTERKNSWPRRAVYRALSRLASGYFINGKETRALLQALGFSSPILSPRNYTCHESFFELTAIEQRSAKLHMFVAAQLIDRKGLRELIEAVGRSPSKEAFLLSVVGEGPLASELRQLVEQQGLTNIVKLLGKVPRNRVLELLVSCDLAMLPTKEDNWSLSIVEALAAGKPAVTTQYNGVSGDIVLDGVNGFIFDVANPRSIDQVLERVIDRRQQLAAMGRAAREIAASVSPASIAKQMRDGILSLHLRDG
ncbi:glycosyltransferase family 4 protein [Devosia sp. A16]|uniref:glycosyltransferase family 4 protein n=1 Tax=Devosia sp. A16 TaxID=1736675 RepID=UPI0009EC958B|nr:glycosyltransferase family 4 protein [Devosia sp. A16]